MAVSGSDPPALACTVSARASARSHDLVREPLAFSGACLAILHALRTGIQTRLDPFRCQHSRHGNLLVERCVAGTPHGVGREGPWQGVGELFSRDDALIAARPEPPPSEPLAGTSALAYARTAAPSSPGL